MNKILNNIFLIIYPIILIIAMLYNNSLNKEIMRFEINYVKWLIVMLIYFIILATFIVKFFIKKEEYSIIAAIIGIIEIIITQCPQFIGKNPYKIYMLINGDIVTNIYIVGTIITMYIILLSKNRDLLSLFKKNHKHGQSPL